MLVYAESDAPGVNGIGSRRSGRFGFCRDLPAGCGVIFFALSSDGTVTMRQAVHYRHFCGSRSSAEVISRRPKMIGRGA